MGTLSRLSMLGCGVEKPVNEGRDNEESSQVSPPYIHEFDEDEEHPKRV